MPGRTANIADGIRIEEVKGHVVHGIIQTAAARGVFTRCLAMYGSGVWIGMTVMLIPVIRLAI
jgi:hypothetical protein